MEDTYDLVVIGAGLAGLTLARQLLLKRPEARILHLEKRTEVPGNKQKVGESTVQVGGYYYSKVLDLEEHLFSQHFMKYNLRFLWRQPDSDGCDYFEYGQGFIQKFSNVASYQIDRNRFETELIRLNRLAPHYTLLTGIKGLEIELGDGQPHQVNYRHEDAQVQVQTAWLVDSSGRKRTLARQAEDERPVALSHGSSWFWVDGIVNLEKLTQLAHDQQLCHPSRTRLGHLPAWLSTNQLMGEGYWFWIITLQERTSFGLVYDQDLISPSSVNKPAKLLPWLFERFPLLRPALEGKDLIDFSTLQQFSYDTKQTISRHKWAISGEAGRFSDPLYSPGSDGIAIHNTLIVDAILSRDDKELTAKVGLFNSMMDVTFRSFLPSFQDSYRALGDHECFYLKYTWELAVYFGFFVFPFVNQLFTDRRFLAGYFRRFALLGPINRCLLSYITDFFKWKQQQPSKSQGPCFTDFLQAPALDRAEKTFYQVGLDPVQALALLDGELASLKEYATFLIAHIDASVIGQEDLSRNADYVASIDPSKISFDPERIQTRYQEVCHSDQIREWTFPTCFLKRAFAAEQYPKPQAKTLPLEGVRS